MGVRRGGSNKTGNKTTGMGFGDRMIQRCESHWDIKEEGNREEQAKWEIKPKFFSFRFGE